MSESYTTGLDDWKKLESFIERGQVFTPRETHILEYIDLQMKLAPLWLPEPIYVYKCDNTGQPVGDALTFSRKATIQKEIALQSTRVRFSMLDTLLQAGQRYIIVLHFWPLILPFHYWGNDKSGQAYYPRGWRMLRYAGAPTWTPLYDECHIFAEFGTPPLPKPEPEPPIPKFAIPSIAYTHYDVGLHIRIPTSVPCHLTCYYTDQKPLKHHRSRVVRGLEVPWGTYFCFVAWQALEQSEIGDTLYHTFWFPDWLEGQTKWFTFRGEVDLENVPSVGPIFEHTHPGSDPLPPLLRPRPPMYHEQCFQYPPYTRHCDKVNEVISDEDATYVQAPAIAYLPPQQEIYYLDDLPPQWQWIDSIKIYARMRRVAQNPLGTYPAYAQWGVRTYNQNYYSSGDLYGNNYATYTKIFTNNPYTGLPWTLDEVNSLFSFIALDWYNVALWQGGYIAARCTQIYIEVTPGIKGGPD